MGILGAHVSIAGGISKSVARAIDLGCVSFQIFTKNQRQWKAPPIPADEAKGFRKELKESGLGPVIAHDSYLVNLGSPEKEMFSRSVEAFCDELDRCAQLGLEYIVAHPGSHVGSGEENGINKIVQGLERSWNDALGENYERDLPMILLETTAGQGTNIGHRFDQLSKIITLSSIPDKMGVCLDTCHIFAAGYDISTPDAYEITISEFDEVIGLDRLKAVHINDSKKGLGSNVDRHDNIGEGMIGLDGFASLVNDRRLEDVPMILETPGEDEMYRKNLSLLRSMIG